MDGQTDGWTDRQMDGRGGGWWMDRRMEKMDREKVGSRGMDGHGTEKMDRWGMDGQKDTSVCRQTDTGPCPPSPRSYLCPGGAELAPHWLTLPHEPL